MNHSSRRTAIVVGLVVVVVAVVVIGAYLLGQSKAPSAVLPTTASNLSSEPSPTYSPTTPEGSAEPDLATGEVRVGEGGSRVGPASLPLGYTQDEAGAASAATNYLIWMNSLRITDKAVADELAAATATDTSARTQLIQSFDLLRSGMENLTADDPEPQRGAYAVADFSDTSATVYVWAPEVTMDTTGATDHVWAIDAVDLVWAAGDWKLAGPVVARTGATAVDPADPSGNPTAAEKHSILARTAADPGEIPDAARQTWFEYGNAQR